MLEEKHKPQSKDKTFCRRKKKDFLQGFLLKLLSFISIHKHQKMHLSTIFYTATLFDLSNDHQQAYRSTTHLCITQDSTKRLKRALNIAEVSSQWKRRWPITITCCFLRLSKVRILPRATNHAKNAALEGAWDCHTFFQGKRLLSEQARE